MEDWKQDRFGSILRGENPTFLCKMKSGFAVLADSQFLPGYCILLGYPVVGSLNELPPDGQIQFLRDMALIGDAILAVCKPLRVNYAIMMNSLPILHAHVQPRYGWEPEENKCRPISSYPEEIFYGAAYEFDEQKHGELKRTLSEYLNRRMP